MQQRANANNTATLDDSQVASSTPAIAPGEIEIGSLLGNQSSTAACVSPELENGNYGTANIDETRLNRMIAKLSTVPVPAGGNADPISRINFINSSIKSVIENLYCFDEKSADQLVGLMNCIFKGDESVFTNNILSNREEYSLLERYVSNGNIGNLLGTSRREGLDIGALELNDRVYLFGKASKDLLADPQWRTSHRTPLSAEEFNLVQHSIDEGVEYITPNLYKTFMAALNSLNVQSLIAPTVNLVNHARENPGTAAVELLSIGTSISWGIQEGLPIHPQVGNDGLNALVTVLANAAAMAGLTDSGVTFVAEIRQALAGENPLGRRMVQAGAIALGAYLASQDNEDSIGTEEAFSMFGAAMAGISAVAALDNFANNARPLVNSRLTQFSELISTSFRNIFPTNNVEAAEAQPVLGNYNDIEIGRV